MSFVRVKCVSSEEKFSIRLKTKKVERKKTLFSFFHDEIFRIGQHRDIFSTVEHPQPRGSRSAAQKNKIKVKKRAMNELNSDENYIKTESDSMQLDHQLDLHNCIEDFDRIIYQVPEEFTINSDFCDGDSNQNGLSGEFTYNIGSDGGGG